MTTKPCCKECRAPKYDRMVGTNYCTNHKCPCHVPATATPMLDEMARRINASPNFGNVPPESTHHSLSPGATLPTYYTGGSMIEIVPEHALDFSEAESVPTQWEKSFDEEIKDTPLANSAFGKGMVKDFIRQIAAAREEAYQAGQQHAFEVDRKAVFEEGRRAMREEILAALPNRQKYFAERHGRAKSPYSEGYDKAIEEVRAIITSKQ